jgi:hypothetical protein
MRWRWSEFWRVVPGAPSLAVLTPLPAVPRGRHTGETDLPQAMFLMKGVKSAEEGMSQSNLTERYDLDTTTLRELMSLQTWDRSAICRWLMIDKKLARSLDMPEQSVPATVVARIFVPLVLEKVDDRRHRAWLLTVAEIVQASCADDP